MKTKYYLRGMGIGVFFTALIFGVALVFYKPKLSEEEIRREAAKLGMVNAVEADIAGTAEEDTSAKVTVENIPGATGAVEDEAAADGEAEAATNATGEGTDAATASAEGEDTAAENEGTDAGDPSMEYQADQKKKDTTGSDATTTTAENNTGTGSGSNGTSNGNSTKTASGNSGSSATPSTAGSSGNSTSSSSTGATGATKKLTIRKGEDSYTTAAHLYKDGLVDNAAKFNTYLESNKYDVKILSGTFNIPEGASYDEIVKIITGK